MGRRAERSGAQAARPGASSPASCPGGEPWIRWHRWESQGSSTEGESRGGGPGAFGQSQASMAGRRAGEAFRPYRWLRY